LERLIMIWVWLVVPLQYYVFTRIPGGMQWQEVFSMALAVSLSVLLVFLCSSILAIVPSRQIGAAYSDRVRAWSLAIITNWSAAVSLLAISYLAGTYLKRPNQDLLQILLCYPKTSIALPTPGSIVPFPCENYPEFAVDTYIIYLLYSSLALVLLLATVVSATGCGSERFPVPAPRTILVPFITAAILSVLYISTKIPLPVGG
jgi:hypothetical protein